MIFAEQQLTAFRSVLMAARKTEYYFPRLEAAHLATREEVRSLHGVEEGLERLPRAELRDLLADPGRFHNRTARPARSFDLGRVEWKPSGWLCALGYQPQALLGTFATLNRKAREVSRGDTAIPASVHRVIVHSSVSTGLLSEEEREALWQAFELPVFEHLLGLDGELLAWECAAHAGLHIQAEHAFVEGPNGHAAEVVLTSLAGLRYPLVRLRTGLIAGRSEGRCGCGHPSPRLMFSASPAALRKPPAMQSVAVDFPARVGLAR